MSVKDDRIAELESDARMMSDVIDCHLRRTETLARMVIRAVREVNEPLIRANLLEELGALVPSALDDIEQDERPEVIRRRTR